MTKWQKLCLFQRLYFYVGCDVVDAIREQMQRKLMGAKGFVAGLVKTDKSSKFYTKDPDTDEVKEQFISSASYSSLANAVVAKVMGRDLVAAHKEELKGETILHHFLSPWAHILSDYYATDLDEFLGIAEKPRWGIITTMSKNRHPRLVCSISSQRSGWSLPFCHQEGKGFLYPLASRQKKCLGLFGF